MIDLSNFTNVRVKWMEGFGNSPDVHFEWVGGYDSPTRKAIRSEFRYQRFDHVVQRNGAKPETHTYWWAEHESGLVSYYAHSGLDRNEGGFGGAEFPITLTDGTSLTLKGPWSSRAVYANAHQLGSGPWQDGSHPMTRELWLLLVETFCPDVYVFEADWAPGMEARLELSAAPDRCVKPNGAEFAEVDLENAGYRKARPYKGHFWLGEWHAWTHWSERD